jgi:ubiquinol-cytochrome c reductase subunit 7
VLIVLRADDLIPEESETVLLALKRLPPKEAYDRVFRMRRAFQVCSLDIFVSIQVLTYEQCSLAHQLLPKSEQTKPEEVRCSLPKRMTK